MEEENYPYYPVNYINEELSNERSNIIHIEEMPLELSNIPSISTKDTNTIYNNNIHMIKSSIRKNINNNNSDIINQSYRCKKCKKIPIIIFLNEKNVKVRCCCKNNNNKIYNIKVYNEEIKEIDMIDNEVFNHYITLLIDKIIKQKINIGNIATDPKNEIIYPNNYYEFKNSDLMVDGFDIKEKSLTNNKTDESDDFDIPEYIKLINKINIKIRFNDDDFECKNRHLNNIENILDFLAFKIYNSGDNILIMEYKGEIGEEIQIVGESFFRDNKKKIEIFVTDKSRKERKRYKSAKVKLNNESIRIILKIGKITNMSGLFKDCKNLIFINGEYCKMSNIERINEMFSKCKSIKELHLFNWDMSNIQNISALFNECESLEILLDISNWKTQSIKDMSNLFYKCKKLKQLPDRLEWDTSIVENISGLFYECVSLERLPNISWKTYNVDNMSNIFCGCKNLNQLPDISKWNTSKVGVMSNLFSECKSLKYLPEISKWNVSNVKDMSYLFNGCESLTSLPDISKWKTSNLENMKYLFNECESLKNLPDISKWDTSKVKDMSNVFNKCKKLEKLPDISKWKTSEVEKMSNLFYGCESLYSLPDISKWDLSKVKDKSNMFPKLTFRRFFYYFKNSRYLTSYIFLILFILIKKLFEDK